MCDILMTLWKLYARVPYISFFFLLCKSKQNATLNWPNECEVNVWSLYISFSSCWSTIPVFCNINKYFNNTVLCWTYCAIGIYPKRFSSNLSTNDVLTLDFPSILFILNLELKQLSSCFGTYETKLIVGGTTIFIVLQVYCFIVNDSLTLQLAKFFTEILYVIFRDPISLSHCLVLYPLWYSMCWSYVCAVRCLDTM